VALPWNSNQLSRRLGVDPDNFARHTAMGDVQWCLAQWRAMNGEGDRS
jgi:DNA polymerase III epsilon subunit-like protein